MKTYCYDIEVYPTLFAATFVNVDDVSDKRVFYAGLDKPDFSDIVSFLKEEMVLIGYNNISYDDPVLRFVMGYHGPNLTGDLFNLSSKLVNDVFRSDPAIMALRYPRNVKYSWTSIDLMAILAFDKLGISLKQTAINLKWHKIQDLPLPFDCSVTLKDLDLILDYNLNDVLITLRLYETIAPIRALRSELSKLYNINLLSASDSKMANLILENLYAKEFNKDIKTIREMRTHRESVNLGECVAPFVSFKSDELNSLLDRIRSTTVFRYENFKYSESLFFAGCDFKLGVGGLHTEDNPGIFVSDDNYLIQDCDGASYYPNLIINNNFYPKHLGKDFITMLSMITKERIAAKKAGDKYKADGLKITINSIFGKMGSETFWLLDPKQMLSTTISGQMGLLMLVEEFYEKGIEVISCNTDGIICRIPREKLDDYYSVTKDWEEKTHIELEFTPYKKYVRRDVNSYITVKEDGHTKEKGAFVTEVDLKKSYHMPIVAKALYAYFINGKPIRETLEKCKDIMEFCISQKSGKDFGIELHKSSGIIALQKTNRFFISKNGGSLIKRAHFTGKTIGLYVGKQVKILNDYDESLPFESYEVNLSFYEEEAQKIIDLIEPPQLFLFELSTLERGRKTKMDVPKSKVEKSPVELLFRVETLNKLGKNQFLKQVEDIVSLGKSIENLSRKYVFILSLDIKTKVVDVYCLSTGKKQTIAITEKAYKKFPINKGVLIYCDAFEKKKDVFKISDYHIVEKFGNGSDELWDTKSLILRK